MSTNKPIPSATPPRIAGVALKASIPSTTPAPGPASQENKRDIYPQELPGGDILLGVLEGDARHSVRLIKRTDSSQKIPFLMDCKCGTQARVFSENDLRQAADRHLAIRSVRELPL